MTVTAIGRGKNLFLDGLMEAIGAQYVAYVADSRLVTGSFNDIIENKLLIALDEVYITKANDMNQLKSLVSECSMNLKKKFRDVMTIPVYYRVLLFSNHRDGIQLEASDRRYFCAEVSDQKVGNDKYYTDLVAAMKTPGFGKALFDHLMGVDLGDGKIGKPPMTALKRELVLSNAPAFTKWLNYLLDVQRDPAEEVPDQLHDPLDDVVRNKPRPRYVKLDETRETWYTSEELLESFRWWCKNRDEACTYTSKPFLAKLQKVLGEHGMGHKKNQSRNEYSLPAAGAFEAALSGHGLRFD
eukprot:g3421.t1